MIEGAFLPAGARPPRILLVDDEPANLRLLGAILEREGYTDLVPLADPHAVVACYREAPTDLIVLDLRMPGLDGLAVLAQLQALQDRLLPPVMVLTAQREREVMLRALAAGARDYLCKPFDRAELVMRVRNLLDAHLAHRMLHERQRVLEEMVQVRTRELHDSRLQLLRRLGRAAEFRDEETGNHILRMSCTAAMLARAAGWSDDGVELMLNAAPMHDIGKIGIPDHILLKPGRLDAAEWALMQTHAEIGARLLEGGNCELLELARTIAWTHHEKWDGSGYPRGLAGEAIPQAGRICAIADVFDALLSARPYKRRWGFDQAVAHLIEHAGSHFEPRLVELFVGRLDEVAAIRERFPDAAPG